MTDDTSQTEPELEQLRMNADFVYQDADSRFDAREWVSLKTDEMVGDDLDIDERTIYAYPDEADTGDESVVEYDGPGTYFVEAHMTLEPTDG